MMTKSKSISEILRQEIVSGKFDAEGRLPSEHQLMRRFSVVITFVVGAAVFRERNLLRKGLALAAILAGVVLLCLG